MIDVDDIERVEEPRPMGLGEAFARMLHGPDWTPPRPTAMERAGWALRHSVWLAGYVVVIVVLAAVCFAIALGCLALWQAVV